MTELKTLKDIPFKYLEQEDEEMLRQEAIKKAKHYTYKANQKGLEDRDVMYWTARRVEVMEFNNITEEDLLEPLPEYFKEKKEVQE